MVAETGSRTPAVVAGEFWREVFAAFPDFEIEFERIVADDRNAALYWTARGTFTGEPFAA